MVRLTLVRPDNGRSTSAMSILKTKVVLTNGVIVEIKIWEMSRQSKQYPDGFKYSLYAVFCGKTLVGYDNHHPKGHHKHIGDEQLPYEFSTLDKLKDDFRTDLKEQINREGLQ